MNRSQDSIDRAFERASHPTTAEMEQVGVRVLQNLRSQAAISPCAKEVHVTQHRRWRLLVSGKVVNESPRWEVLRDTLMHLAHHRGQLTVYLRLNDAPVPAIYGPSADDQHFA